MDDQSQRMKVLGAGIFSLMLALGVARFAYTPLLPLMQAQAGLGLAEGGWLAAINYAGYLTGALTAASISDLVLKDRLFRIGMVVAVLTTVMMGLSTDFWVWAVSRYLAGLASAASMLLGTGGDPVVEIAHVRPGDYSACVVLIAGSLMDPKVAEQLTRSPDTLPVTCVARPVPASPALQELELALP